MPELTKRMAMVLRAMARLREEGSRYPPTPNEIAIECGFWHGMVGDDKHARDGRRMAPANRINFALTALDGHGLIHYNRRRDGLSGTAYRLTEAGLKWIEENGAEDAP